MIHIATEMLEAAGATSITETNDTARAVNHAVQLMKRREL